jgi:hypothetical protein
MNLFEAIKILELPNDYSPELVNQQFKKFAMKYHPDKCKDPDAQDQFIKIKEAHLFISNYTKLPQLPQFNFSTIFKTFVNLAKPLIKPVHIEITPLEYFTGTIKEINIPVHCNCEKKLCEVCAGSGYCLEIKQNIKLEVCMGCLGDCWIKKCKCSTTTIIIPKRTIDIVFNQIKINIKLTGSDYTFGKNNTLMYKYDITLKDSLIGFEKTFNDPFGDTHLVSIKNTIIKQNDGYMVMNDSIILLFNIIYPKNISIESKKLLKEIIF